MPRAYSTDLRARVIAASLAGDCPRREIAAQYQISEATLFSWLQRWRQSGSVAPTAHSGGRTSELDEDLLRELVGAQSDATLAEYAERLAEKTGRLYSVSLISRALKRMRLSRKRRRYAPANIWGPRSSASA